ncbi:UbiA family prenyltransferase [Haladaptatus sp. GCM10025707]|uniref:UbiA family prenyltransferase n=1 Tax=unclassified Haladaptatus TaxID=2622732 RepID=UPI0023E7D047|nr:UbiA family prenyltransferase [Haladaptatus sp. QDMS2]
MSRTATAASILGTRLHRLGTTIAAPAALSETGQRFYDLVIHGTLFLGLVAATKILVVALLLSVPLNPAVLIAFLVSFTIYTHNKLTDLNEDAINNPDRVAFIEPRKRLFLALSVGAYLLALVVSAFGGLMAFLLTLLPGVAAVLYSEPWLPLFEADRLKEVLLVNTTLVAISWAAPVAFLPLAFAGKTLVIGGTVVFVFFFLRTFIAGEVLNVRDVAGDREEGIPTLPVAVGVKRTQIVLYALDIGSLGLVVIAGVFGTISTLHGLALAPAIVYSMFITSMLTADVNLRHLGTMRDFEYILMAVALLATVVLF